MHNLEKINIFKEHAKTFYLASLFFNKETFEKVINLYSFCRINDDLVDTPDTNFSNNPLSELEEKLKYYGIEEQVISQLQNGISSDINFEHIQNHANLIIYCYRVAGTVGLMMCKIMKLKDNEANYFAIDLGIAMQLTNIIRDIKADALIGRVYIPDQDIKAKDIVDESKSKFRVIKNNMQNLELLATHYYESALHGLRYIPLRSRFVILIALRLYQAIGKKVLRKNHIYSDKKLYINMFEKILIIIKTFLEFVIFHIYSVKKNNHKPLNHLYIKDLPHANRNI